MGIQQDRSRSRIIWPEQEFCLSAEYGSSAEATGSSTAARTQRPPVRIPLKPRKSSWGLYFATAEIAITTAMVISSFHLYFDSSHHFMLYGNLPFNFVQCWLRVSMGCSFDGWRLNFADFDGWRLNFRAFDGWRLWRGNFFHELKFILTSLVLPM